MSIPSALFKDKPVIIIGGGWSGLACAIYLVQHGIKVHLLESARQAGGRARSIHLKKSSLIKHKTLPLSYLQFNNVCKATTAKFSLLKAPGNRLTHQSLEAYTIDNGQHIMLGAYHSTLNLFKTIGLNETEILERQTLTLKLFAPNHPLIELKAPPLPAPLHLIAALIKMQGLTSGERLSAIIMSLKLAFKKYSLNIDISVHDLLVQYQQSDKVIKTLWEPLCLATMNTPIHYASAQVFLKVLKDSFSRKRKDSDLLFFKKDLSLIFNDPAVNYIIQHNGQVDCASKVTELNINYSSIKHQSSKKPVFNFIINTHDASFQTDTVVLATPPHISDKLLHSRNNCSIIQSNSFLIPNGASLNYYYEPICTIYLHYPPSVTLPSTMVGFFDSNAQWAIDRSLCQQSGLIAVVISGPGKHTQIPHKQLADIIHSELKSCISQLPQWLDYRVITERKATFSCRVDINQQRPLNKTIIPGLFLAGDYTKTGYPATLEGAVRSGINAARQIILAKS